MAPRTVATGVLLGMLVAGIYISIDRSRDMQRAAALAEAEALAKAKADAAKAQPAPKATVAPRPTATTPAPTATSAEGPPPSDSHPGMTLVSGGTFQPGFSTHPIDVKPFYLDTTLVTRASYLTCDECAKPASSLVPDASVNDMPMVEVTWADATKFCAWMKKRLPTEPEWEFAARGLEGRKFAWGNETPNDQLCWRRNNGPCPVGSFPNGDTPLGLKDMTGNVWQWMAEERFCPNPDYVESCDKGTHPARGGAWNVWAPTVIEAGYRNAMRAPTTYIGFRCAAD